MTPQEKNQLELSVPEESTLPQLFETSEKKHFLDHFIILARHKSFILYFTAVVAALTVGYTVLFMDTYYQATVRIMPPQQGQSFASAMLDQLGGLAPLLGAGGKDLLKNPSDLYVDMLRSRRVADDLVDHFSLMSRYKAKMREDARKRLAGLSEIAAAKDGVISIAVEDTDPKFAAEVSNQYVDELEGLTKTLAVTDAQKRRIFFDEQAKTAQGQLEAAEQDLKKTQETTGIFQMDSQSRVMLQAYEDVRAQLTAKEYEIASMRSSFAAAENPDLIRLERERDALRSQVGAMEKGQGGSPVGDIALEKVPEKYLKYVDKLREVTYRSALLQLMLKQYEAARVDEAKDFALIQVLDKAQTPERKSRPHRGIICIILTLLAFLVACLWSYFREGMKHAKEDPQYLARLQLLKFYLSRKPHRAR